MSTQSYANITKQAMRIGMKWEWKTSKGAKHAASEVVTNRAELQHFRERYLGICYISSPQT